MHDWAMAPSGRRSNHNNSVTCDFSILPGLKLTSHTMVERGRGWGRGGGGEGKGEGKYVESRS